MEETRSRATRRKAVLLSMIVLAAMMPVQSLHAHSSHNAETEFGFIPNKDAELSTLKKQDAKELHRLSTQLKTTPGWSPALRERARLYVRHDMPNRAIADLRQVFGDKAEFYGELAGNFYQAKKVDTAFKIVNICIAKYPNSPVGYGARGEYYEFTGRPVASYKDFSKAIELGSKEPMVYAFRSIQHSQMLRGDEALQDINRAIECWPTNPSLYKQRGKIYLYLLHKPALAQTDFDHAKSMKP